MHKPGPPLKMLLLTVCFLGLAEACVPREVATEEKMRTGETEPGVSRSACWSEGVYHAALTIQSVRCLLGLLSLQVLNEETKGCKEEVKLSPATTTPKKPPKKKTRWSGLRCAYMMITFLFVSYNKGDWCYCHYCNPELDNRNDPCCAF
ncbi:epididymal protein 13 [Vicugna pacos]|uniref:Epididymal protein 13 n=1 Tax=Vicugna pacos TaxID=30538 RepID=A0ABM5DVP3_VICPA